MVLILNGMEKLTEAKHAAAAELHGDNDDVQLHLADGAITYIYIYRGQT